MSKPLVVDLFCGLGGWTSGFLAEGWGAVGFDIERHMYGGKRYPAQLVIQDVLTLDGRQFAGASAIACSPPCQNFSYMAMPWTRAKAIAAGIRADYSGAKLAQLTALFDACFRIQREASQAAGRHIPMCVENVKGAQPWVGRAKARYGSYFLWGDVESVGGAIVAARPQFGEVLRAGRRLKGTGGSWFEVSEGRSDPRDVMSRGETVPGMNFHDHEQGLPGRSFQTAAVAATGVKGPGGDWFADGRQGQDACLEGIKNSGGSWFGVAHNTESGHLQNPVNGAKQHGSGAAWFDEALDDRRREATATKNAGDWFGSGADCSLQRKSNSRSNSRKAASAMIAEIPLPLARWVARQFHPERQEAHVYDR